MYIYINVLIKCVTNHQSITVFKSPQWMFLLEMSFKYYIYGNTTYMVIDVVVSTTNVYQGGWVWVVPVQWFLINAGFNCYSMINVSDYYHWSTYGIVFI